MTAKKWFVAVMIGFSISLIIGIAKADSDTEQCWVCNFDRQLTGVGVIDLDDMLVLAEHWLETGCSDSDWCMGTDLDFSDAIDLRDFAIFASCFQNADDIAPDPVQWTQKPFGTFLGGDLVTMTLADSFDTWTGDWTKDPDNYYTDYVIERRTAHELEFNEIKTIRIDSPNPDPDVWPRVNTLEFNDTDVYAAYEYTYRFKVVDAAGNQSQWSTEETAFGGYDIKPPENVRWKVFPNSIHIDSSIVRMEADIAVDQNQYLAYLFVRLDMSGSAAGSVYGHSMESYGYWDTILTPFDEPTPTDSDQLLQYANDNQETMPGWLVYDKDDTYQNAINFQDVGLLYGNTYDYYFLVRDAFGNIAISEVASVEDIDGTPPDPNPSTWESIPTAYDDIDGFHHHYMVATPAVDPQSPNVEYYFETFDGSKSSGWITENSFDVRVPAANNYRWRHRSRSIDYNALGEVFRYNVTDWSSQVAPDITGSDPIDQTPPDPNPPVWDAMTTAYKYPQSIFSHHFLVAAPAVDAQSPNVEYYFETVSGSISRSSSWITENYFDTKVPANYHVTWRHRTRSIVYNEHGEVVRYNVTDWSDTIKPDVGNIDDIDQTPPFPNPSTWDTLPTGYVDASGFHHHFMVAAHAVDPQSQDVEYYFETLGGIRTSGWITENSFDIKVPAINTYRWRHRTRSIVYNEQGEVLHYNETDWSDAWLADNHGDEIDQTPPSPNPSIWETLPTGFDDPQGFHHHYMLAEPAVDAQSPDIEYYFETLNSSKTSGWITENAYDVIVPKVNNYQWRHRTRSIVYNTLAEVIRYNVTDWSDAILPDVIDNDDIDQTPPDPNPSVWETLPTGYDEITGIYHHYMAAAPAVDPESQDVEYYFETLSGSKSSGWITENSYDAIVPKINTYRWRHRTRSIVYNALGEVSHYNVTDWSEAILAGNFIDTTPPVPNPSTWNAPPTGYEDLRGFHHYMVATSAFDSQSHHIQYNFTTLDGAISSGWISDNSYEALVPYLNNYQWRHRTRSIVYNKLGQITHFNVTQWSEAIQVDDPIDTTPPVPNPPTWVAPPTGFVDIDGFHHHYMIAAPAIDPQSPIVEYYFETLGGARASGWIPDNVYDSKVPAANTYTWRHRTRSIVYDALGQIIHYNVSQWSQALSATDDIDQTPPDPNPPTWETPPTGWDDPVGIHHHYMVATPAIDAQSPDVEYYFETLGGSRNSGWITKNSYGTIIPSATPNFWHYRTRSTVYNVLGQVMHYNVSDWSEAVLADD